MLKPVLRVVVHVRMRFGLMSRKGLASILRTFIRTPHHVYIHPPGDLLTGLFFASSRHHLGIVELLHIPFVFRILAVCLDWYLLSLHLHLKVWRRSLHIWLWSASHGHLISWLPGCSNRIWRVHLPRRLLVGERLSLLNLSSRNLFLQQCRFALDLGLH